MAVGYREFQGVLSRIARKGRLEKVWMRFKALVAGSACVYIRKCRSPPDLLSSRTLTDILLKREKSSGEARAELPDPAMPVCLFVSRHRQDLDCFLSTCNVKLAQKRDSSFFSICRSCWFTDKTCIWILLEQVAKYWVPIYMMDFLFIHIGWNEDNINIVKHQFVKAGIY